MVVVEDAEDAAGPASKGTVPYSLLHPGHWLRQCSLICCTQNRHTRYLQAYRGVSVNRGEGGEGRGGQKEACRSSQEQPEHENPS